MFEIFTKSLVQFRLYSYTHTFPIPQSTITQLTNSFSIVGTFCLYFFILCFLQCQNIIIKHCILWILISFLHQKLANLKLHCFQKRVYNFEKAMPAGHFFGLNTTIKLFTANDKQSFFLTQHFSYPILQCSYLLPKTQEQQYHYTHSTN